MRSILALLVCVPLLAATNTAMAQDGAPLITGLGGPFDVGVPHDGRGPLAVAPAFPEGIAFFRAVPEESIFLNWSGALSFEYADFNGFDPIPRPLIMDEFSFPRIAGLGHSVNLFDLRQAGETVTYFANQPAGEDEPGRLIATWYRVPDRVRNPPFPDTEYNTWQVILTAGPAPDRFDIEFRYHACRWTHGVDQDDLKSIVGFDGGEGAEGPGWVWPGSRSDDVLLLCSLSNVREPGVFRYQVIDGIPTGCGIDAEPPPGPDRCADGNHLPGDGCSPACYLEPDVDSDGVTEAPHPDSVDPRGVYDQCTDLNDEACNDDTDGDGIPPHIDNCDDVDNPEQYDYDGDRVGDACDPDDDFDTLPEVESANQPADICPLIYSRSTRRPDPRRPTRYQQPDIDGDGLGDACDPDDDGDGVLDCGGDGICNPDDDGYNNDFDDETDEGGECAEGTDCHFGDRDFFDNDGDGFVDEYSEIEFAFVEWPGRDQPPSLPEDNCRRIPNPDQLDQDGDGIGDACDPDIDGDDIPNCEGNGMCGPLADGRDNDEDGEIDEDDECVEGCDEDPDLIDQDFDGWVDEAYERQQADDDGLVLPAVLDNCPRIASQNLADWDNDGVGDLCDDSDGDGDMDAVDNCRENANPEQEDADGDGQGDVCDDDLDGDGIPNDRDSCPDKPNDGVDTDGDGRDNICDEDDDDDGVNDIFDKCPLIYDSGQENLDGDDKGDACDADVDGDGIDNEADACPRVHDGPVDTDGDGAGDLCDDDDDGDGVPDDAPDICPLVADPDQLDLDGDGIGDACDPNDDRPFEIRTPEEKCAILIHDRAPTAERLRHCPPPVDDGCATTPGGSASNAWWLLGLLGLARRRR